MEEFEEKDGSIGLFGMLDPVDEFINTGPIR